MSDFSTLLAVGDMADKNIVTIGEEVSIREAATTMKDKNADSLLMLNDDGEAMGILTEQDIVRRAVADNLNLDEEKAAGIMTANPITIPHNASIFDAKSLMTENDAHHLIVVNDGKPMGILTAKAVLG